MGTDKLGLPELWSDFINELLLSRKTKNETYSSRALARDLHLSHSLLSLIINKKRIPSDKSMQKIRQSLKETTWQERIEKLILETKNSLKRADLTN